MVKFLKEVKMNSIIIMAIRDSSSDRNWNDEQISYVDGYGSETYKNDANRGCPFIMCQFVIKTDFFSILKQTF